MSEVKNMPALRFSEFSLDWQKIKVGDAGKVSMCKRIMKDETKPIGDIPFFKIGTFGKEPDAFITKELFEEYKQKFSFPKNGDILISAAGTIGRTVVFDGAPAYFQDSNIVWIDNNEDKVTNPFLYYCYQKIRWITDDTTIARLYNDNLRSKKLFIPTVSEQQKIADFLSSVDKKIEQLTEKHRLLTEYKKGVMQQIFTQQIRFKDNQGNDYPEWEEVQLKDVSKVYQPRTISQSDLTDGGFAVYGANGVIGFYSEFNHEYAQIAVTCRGNTCGTVNWTEPKSWITGNAMVINFDGTDKVFKKFFYYQLSHHNLNYLITGSGQPQITGDIKKHLVFKPCLDEQQKITNFLTEIDQKIDQAWSTLEQTKAFKKGLLEKMFV